MWSATFPEVDQTAEERAEQKMLAEKVSALRRHGGVFAEISGKGRAGSKMSDPAWPPWRRSTMTGRWFRLSGRLRAGD